MVDYAGRQPIIFRAPSSTLDAKAQAELAATYAAAAQVSAQASAAAAQGRIYASYAAGNAATTAGQYFFVAASGAYDLYLHGTATPVAKLPTLEIATGNLLVSANTGLGNTSPSGRLDVTADSSAIALRLRARVANDFAFLQFVTNNGVTSWADVYATASALRFATGGTDRLLVSGGSILPGADNTQPLGGGSARWSVVYAGTGSINTSDRDTKTDIGDIPDAWLDAWADVEWCRFKFSGGTRWHVGLVAQQVHEAFAAHDLDAFEIGLCCFDEWEATPAEPEVRTEDGFLLVAARPAGKAGSRWGLRYDECEAMEAAYQRREIANLKALVGV